MLQHNRHWAVGLHQPAIPWCSTVILRRSARRDEMSYKRQSVFPCTNHPGPRAGILTQFGAHMARILYKNYKCSFLKSATTCGDIEFFIRDCFLLAHPVEALEKVQKMATVCQHESQSLQTLSHGRATKNHLKFKTHLQKHISFQLLVV